MRNNNSLSLKAHKQDFIIPRYRYGTFLMFVGGISGIAGLLFIAAALFNIVGSAYVQPAEYLGLAFFTAAFLTLIFTTVRLKKGFSTADAIARIMRERSDRYARAAFGSHEGLWDIDIKTGDAFFSDGWHKMLGLPEDSVRSIDGWQARVHPEDKKSAVDALTQHANRLRMYYEAEYRIQNRHGAYVWISDRGSSSDNLPFRVAGFSRDVMREKNVEELLQGRTTELARARDAIEKEIQNTRKFSQAVEAATDPIAIITPSGNVTYANDARSALLGLQRNDMIGRHMLAPYREKTAKMEIAKLNNALRGGRAFSSENFIGERTDGSIFEAAISVFPVREKGVVVFFTSLEQDITKRKNIDRAKTEFVSLASHQLRTPLTVIRWHSEMLLKGQRYQLADAVRKYVLEIYNANRRMIQMINALLNVSRIDLGVFTINPRPTDLTALMESVIKEMAPQIISKQLHIAKHFGRGLPEVAVDTELFRMVFQNLISNAVKYTSAGGAISVSIAHEGEHITFSVSDDGIGIPKAQQPRVFSKLFRADNARETEPDGTGLGLYVVRAVMEASGGTIRFESDERKGTTFYGIIPMIGSKRREGVTVLG